MIKDSDIPPIRGNPRLGKETDRDASIKYGGGQVKPIASKRAASKQPAPATSKTSKQPAPATSKTSKGKKRKTRQKTFTVPNEEGLERVAKKLGMSQAAIMNLGLAMVIKKFG